MYEYNNRAVDLSDSVRAIEKIKDTILPKLIGGEIISVEENENEILTILDQNSGIDYFRKNEHGLQGIASRVQFGDDYRTFTIRYSRFSGSKTEYEKRKYQIENNYLYPTFTMQAYFDNREDLNLLSIGIIKTVDLYNVIETSDKVRINSSDNEFKYIGWCDIPKGMVKTWIVKILTKT